MVLRTKAPGFSTISKVTVELFASLEDEEGKVWKANNLCCDFQNRRGENWG